MSPLPMITPSAALSAVSPNIAFFNNDASSSFDASESEEEKEQGWLYDINLLVYHISH